MDSDVIVACIIGFIVLICVVVVVCFRKIHQIKRNETKNNTIEQQNNVANTEIQSLKQIKKDDSFSSAESYDGDSTTSSQSLHELNRFKSIHGIDDEDDAILIEQIKDIIEDTQFEQKNNDNNNHLIYKALNISQTNVKAKRRIDDCLFELQKQKQPKELSIDISTTSITVITPKFKAVKSYINLEGIESTVSNTVNNKTPKSTHQSTSDDKHNIRKQYNKKMKQLFNGYDNQNRLDTERKDENCSKLNHDYFKECPCLRRIVIILEIYQRILKYKKHKRLANVIENYLIYSTSTINYGNQDIFNDFQHIHVFHCSDYRVKEKICLALDADYHLTCDGAICKALKRHKTSRMLSIDYTDDDDAYDDDDNKHQSLNIMEANKCDDIHSYFLHSSSNSIVSSPHSIGPSSHSVGSLDTSLLSPSYKFKPFDISPIRSTFSKSTLNFTKSKSVAIDDIPANTDLMFTQSQPTYNTLLDMDDDIDIEFNSIDSKWMGSVNDIDFKEEMKIYEQLITNMGIYRWQGLYGFKSGNHGQFKHLKPKYRNIKVELLSNKYCRISPSQWNSLMTKVQEMKLSSISYMLRTKQAGSFSDPVITNTATWKTDESPSKKDITIIKLYTDYDALQFELKKCLRMSAMHDIIDEYTTKQKSIDDYISDNDDHNDVDVKVDNPVSKKPSISWKPSRLYGKSSLASQPSFDNMNASMDELINRIKSFYHWRGSLLVFINKFADIIPPSPFMLYVGVNSKMILDPTENQSFYGPLSTTCSPIIAAAFSAGKNGMILSISSQYPRLQMCTAYNASIMSAFPEEQEWLVGHIYLRVRNITVQLNVDSIIYLSTESRLKYMFFVMHLFREQIYHMNDTLEQILKPLLYLHLFTTTKAKKSDYQIKTKNKIKNKNKNDDNDIHFTFLQDIVSWAKTHNFDEYKSPRAPGIYNKKNISSPSDKIKKIIRNNRVFYILCKQFEEICRYPNVQQIVKIDCVSQGLRKFFLDHTNKRIKSVNKNSNRLFDLYVVSFKKIINIYPNVKQIYFFNWYKFDDNILRKLIKQIESKKNKLTHVKFLYYDYKNPIENHPFFLHPSKLDIKLLAKLKKLKWAIKYTIKTKQNDKTGFNIKLRSTKKRR